MKTKLPKQLRNLTDAKLIRKLEAGLELVESRLQTATHHADPVIKDAAAHLVNAGGKRVRPVLVMLAAEFGDATKAEVFDAATVVELTHLATLYHDDVMDDAPTRRGVETAQVKWNNNIAILTGDLLFARASQLSVNLGLEVIKIQSQTFERLCLGQMHETVGPVAGQDEVGHYIQVMADKTGSLIAASAQIGLIVAGGDRKYENALIEFGEAIGVAFQLIDDVIDISEAGPSGKTPGTDLRAGVATLPVLLLKERAKSDAAAKELLEQIQGDLSSDAALNSVVAKLRNHAVSTEAEAEARRWAAKAVDALNSLPDGSAKTALITFANAVVDRNN